MVLKEVITEENVILPMGKKLVILQKGKKGLFPCLSLGDY